MLHGRFLYFRTHLSETNTYMYIIIILAITFIIIFIQQNCSETRETVGLLCRWLSSDDRSYRYT